MASDFDSILSSLETDVLRICNQQSFSFTPGVKGKFAALLSWVQLNRILEHHKSDLSRLCLAKFGEDVSPNTYNDYVVRNARWTSVLSFKDLNEQLRNGATLIVNDINRFHTPLASFTESLERRLGVRIGINAYAGWRTCPGLNIHADEYDVFIVQLYGRKRWRIYDSGAKEIGAATDWPDKSIWDQVIEDGDLLYIPRGCKHVAVPLDEPCLHLTVSICNPTASDVLHWIADELHSDVLSQGSIRRFADSSERLRFVEYLTATVLNKLNSEVLDSYFYQSDQRRDGLNRSTLPWSATREGLPRDSKAFLRLNSRRPVSLQLIDQAKAIQFTIGGETWRYPKVLGAILEPLTKGVAVSISDLIALGQNTPGEVMARAFITTLIAEGIALIEGD